jgi:hypothetical protein
MSAAEVPAAPYVLDGDTVLPTDWARGPWFAEQQHGASLLGLMTRFLERVPSRSPMRFTRISADLSRPVPMQPMQLTTRALRDGRRVQSLEVTIAVDGTVLSRAVATRIRVDPGLIPAELLPQPHEGDESPPFVTEETPYGIPGPSFQDRVESRKIDAAADGNGRAWYRLRGQLIVGEEPSPLVRLGSIADMVQSSASRLAPGWISINPEVSFQIEREPIGEWVCVTSAVRFTDDGVGMSEAVLHDRSGRIGRSSKSVLNHRAPEGHRANSERFS